jgi:predicted Fe-Mo cluster-binding NifX family protein
MNISVAIVNSRAEAELLAGMLRNNGIKAIVSADDLGGVDLALQAQGVRVLIPEEDRVQAEELLNSLGVSTAQPKPPNAFQRWLFRILGGNK